MLNLNFSYLEKLGIQRCLLNVNSNEETIIDGCAVQKLEKSCGTVYLINNMEMSLARATEYIYDVPHGIE